MSEPVHTAQGTHATTGDNRLGRALRRWRDRADPADSGLPTGRRRRAAGLRREELAALAGMSVDYVVRLEQGRATSPSGQVLTALARALRLSEEERRHLFLLGGRALPDSAQLPTRVSPGMRRLLEQLPGTPVSVYDAAWTLLEWNPLFAALMGDPSHRQGWERNVLWQHFTGQPTPVRQHAEQEAHFEAATVADLRTATARYPSDPALRGLVAELCRRSPAFLRLWEEHAVGRHTRASKTVEHPEVGTVALDCDVLIAPDSDLRVVLYTAAKGTDAAEKLALLNVVGLQRLWA
ncbi:helix-turn-helix transcriptional regulator [Streptomyces smyrnaeus]|uniref:helix-turn-helix transcriptional regulator n=1 Tax=Streptomyces smyrnaeus TaxID=1387713 RepID=UPI001616EC4F